MEKVSRSLRFPVREDIVRLNRRHLEMSGEEYFEPENLHNEGSLEWVLGVIQYPLFGVDRYPTLAEKAAMLAWIIISGHVFWDGNKRTGMSVLDVLLRWNGCYLDATNEDIVQVALRVAGVDPRCCYNEFLEWVRSKQRFGTRFAITMVSP